MNINKAELCGDQARTTSPRFPFQCSYRFNLTTRNQHNTWKAEVKQGTLPTAAMVKHRRGRRTTAVEEVQHVLALCCPTSVLPEWQP